MEKIMELFRKIEKAKDQPEAREGGETYVVVGLGNPSSDLRNTPPPGITSGF